MKLYYYERGCEFMNAVYRNAIVPKVLHPGVDSLPGVWCSLQEEWNADSYLLDVDKDGIIWTTNLSLPHVANSFGRIEVNPNLGFMELRTFAQIGGVRPKFAEAMVTDACRVGIDPDCWRFSLAHIPASKWISAESYTKGGWRAMPCQWQQR